jgi:hypothetical protein
MHEVKPSPAYPTLHEQLWVPGKFVHVACAAQAVEGKAVHSSTSAQSRVTAKLMGE